MASRYYPTMEPYTGKVPKPEKTIAFDVFGNRVSLKKYLFEGRINFEGKTFKREVLAPTVIEATKICLGFVHAEQNRLGVDNLERPQHNGEWLIDYCTLENGSTLGQGTMKDLVNGLLTIDCLKDL